MMRVGTHARGFSLIELMVAMTLGLILTFGVITFLQDSLQSSRANISRGQMQQVALSALDVLKTDMRMAGFRGECVPSDTLPEVNSALPDLFAVAGNEQAGQNSDLLRLYTADIVEDDLFLWRITPATQELQVCANPPLEGAACEPAEFEDDDLLLLSDCERWVVFQPNSTSTAAEPVTRIRAQANDDGNTPDFSQMWLPGSDPNVGLAGEKASDTPTAVLYRIGSGNDAGTTVYEVVRSTDPDQVSSGNLQLNQLLRNGEPILFGVEGLQVLYGVETGGRVRFREGCTGTDAQSEFACAQALRDTTQIRVSLIMQSDQRLGDIPARRLPVADLNETYETATDGRMREVYSTTVQIRNRSSN